MAAVSSFIVATLAVASVAQGVEARKDAKAAAAEQRKANNEQRAQNAAAQANERRQQVREERIRRAKILQTSQNSGTAGSSGEAGALGSLTTQLGSAIGMNVGRAQAGERISTFMQNAADYNLSSQNHMLNSQAFGQLAGMASTVGGAIGKTPANPSVPTVQPLNTSTPVPVGDAYWKS